MFSFHSPIEVWLRAYAQLISFGALPLAVVAANPWANAQTLPDRSLGSEASVVTSQGVQDLVTGGAVRSSGLFHSFEDLSVAEGRSLYFDTPLGIDHIFSRVTGHGSSTINGTLGVLGHADLFLLNPHGILFGPHAQLDIAGSFVGSTASGLQFDGFEFSAVAPESVPLLTVTAPIGLNLAAHAGTVLNQSSTAGLGLRVQPFQTLALVGGDIRLVGGRMTNRSGRLELAAVQSGTVGLSADSSGWRLDYGSVNQRGEIQLSEQSLIQTQYQLDNPASSIHLVGDGIRLRESAIATNIFDLGRGIDIELNGDRIELLDGASVQTGVGEAATGGEIRINATQMLRLQGSGNNPSFGANHNSKVLSNTVNESSGIGGAIAIKTGQLLAQDGGELLSLTGFFSTGAGGDIRIQATESLIAENSIATEFRNTIGTETKGSGRSGNLIIKTGQFQLDESYRLSSLSWVNGDGGDIEIEADSISLNGTNPFSALLPSGITALAFGSGNSGNIQIKTQDLAIAESANLITTVLGDRATIAGLFSLFFGGDFSRLVDSPGAGTGNAGDIRVMADTVRVTGVTAGENSQPSNLLSGSTASGNAGDVEITTRTLEITQGAVVGSSTAPAVSFLFGAPVPGAGSGQGGNLTVNADRILVKGSSAVFGSPSALATQALGSGDGGDTTINTRELLVRDGAFVAAGTSNSGAGGELKVTASESILVDGQSEAIQVNGQLIPAQPSTLGTFATPLNLLLINAFALPEDAPPEGDTGQLLLNTPRLEITNGGLVSVEHQGSGDAGELEINANHLRLSDKGIVSATSLSGRGGNLELNIQGILSLRRGSQVTAEAFGDEGSGGNLDIDAGVILAIPAENSDIVASSAGGAGGNITLRTGGLFGIEFREQPSLTTNDITASSDIGLDGTVNVDLLATDPSQGLTALPTTPLNPNEQISTACNSRSRTQFVITGRGGLPVDPRQDLTQFSLLEDWREAIPASVTRDGSYEFVTMPQSPRQSPPSQPSIYEAEGWHIDSNGTIRITLQGTGSSSVITDVKKKCSPFSDG